MLQFCSNKIQWIGLISTRNLQKFLKRNIKMTHDITRKSKQILPQNYFLKNIQILVFWRISKISIAFFFVIFSFSQKNIFSQVKLTFVSRFILQIQPKCWTLFGGGGGGKIAIIYPTELKSPISPASGFTTRPPGGGDIAPWRF